MDTIFPYGAMSFTYEQYRIDLLWDVKRKNDEINRRIQHRSHHAKRAAGLGGGGVVRYAHSMIVVILLRGHTVTDR